MKSKIPLLKIFISILLLGILILSIDIHQLKIHLISVNPWGFGFITALFLISVTINSYRWMKFLHAVDIPVNFYAANALSFIGRFFNNFLPTSFGGDALKIFYLFRNEGKLMLPLISVIYDRIVGFLSMMALGILGLMWIKSPVGIPISAFRTLYISGGIVLFIIYSTFWYGHRISLLFSKTLSRFQNKLIKEKINPLLKDLSALKPSLRLIPILFIISFVGNFLSIYTVYLLSILLHMNASFPYFLLFLPAISLLAGLPFTLGGLGIREASFVFFFSSAGFTREQGLSLGLLVALLNLITSLIGLYYYLRYRGMGFQTHCEKGAIHDKINS